MSQKRLSRLELRIMEALWTQGSASVREIQESFPQKGSPMKEPPMFALNSLMRTTACAECCSRRKATT